MRIIIFFIVFVIYGSANFLCGQNSNLPAGAAISIARYSGTVAFRQYVGTDSFHYKSILQDTGAFTVEKFKFLDSSVFIIRQSKNFALIPLRIKNRVVYNYSDSSLSINGLKMECLGVVKDTVRNFSCLKYYYNEAMSDDEENKIYFSPDFGIVYSLNFWWFCAKYSYTNLSLGFDTAEVDFKEWEAMVEKIKE